MAGNHLPIFNQTVTNDPALNQVQINLVRTLNPVFQTPILGGNLLTSQPLALGPNTINHGLGRVLNGWIIVRQRAEASIWDSQDSNNSPKLTLILNSSAATNCDIYVF